jgi:hypothetical protein
MFAQACLATEHHPGSYRGAPRNPDLRNQDRTLADLNVVSDLHKIIDFHARSDLGLAERPTINRGVTANLNVIAYFHPANLWKFNVAGTIENIPKAVTANDNSRVYFDTIVQPGAWIHRHAGMQPAALSDVRTAAQETECIHNRPTIHLDFVFDHNVRAYTNVRRESRGRTYDRGGMDSRAQRRPRHQPSRCLREGQLRIFDLEQSFFLHRHPGRNDNAEPRRARSPVYVPKRIDVDHITGTRAFRACHTHDWCFRVSEKLCTQELSKFTGGMSHGVLFSKLFLICGIQKSTDQLQNG